jgi:hypothetical protein
VLNCQNAKIFGDYFFVHPTKLVDTSVFSASWNPDHKITLATHICCPRYLKLTAVYFPMLILSKESAKLSKCQNHFFVHPTQLVNTSAFSASWIPDHKRPSTAPICCLLALKPTVIYLSMLILLELNIKLSKLTVIKSFYSTQPNINLSTTLQEHPGTRPQNYSYCSHLQTFPFKINYNNSHNNDPNHFNRQECQN